MLRKIIFILAILVTNIAFAKLPLGFVYLEDIDPSIKIATRYAQNNNFTGNIVAGYEKDGVVILTKEAAEALKKAQSIFLKDGYSIVVYDAYRPQMAVDSFVRWAKNIDDQKMKLLFYPRTDKRKLFDLGYIFEKSSHTRGSTVDISLIETNKKLHSIKTTTKKLNDGFEIYIFDDGTLDMGSSFDLFDKSSNLNTSLIKPEYKLRRTYLRMVMELCGFNSYEEEWWHFTLKNEPFPETYFNFKVR